MDQGHHLRDVFISEAVVSQGGAWEGVTTNSDAWSK